jgi:predicted enzyme related to lactoylglutathione lyase
MPQIASLVPMLFVNSVNNSIAFYSLLGFDVGNTFKPPDQSEPTWAWMRSGGANLMVARASHPVVAEEQGLIMYLYCDDVAACHSELAEKGVGVGEITYPFYSPKGEFRVKDPDGYDISVSHT